MRKMAFETSRIMKNIRQQSIHIYSFRANDTIAHRVKEEVIFPCGKLPVIRVNNETFNL